MFPSPRTLHSRGIESIRALFVFGAEPLSLGRRSLREDLQQDRPAALGSDFEHIARCGLVEIKIEAVSSLLRSH